MSLHQLPETIRVIAARATPVPDVNTQVVNELKEVAGAAKERTNTVFQNLPALLTRAAIALGVLLAGVVIFRIIRFLIRKIMHARSNASPDSVRKIETSRSIITSVISYLWYFVVVAVALRLIGLDLTSILAAAGVVGIAIAFGAQTMVQDLLSGLFIWGEGSITVGDIVTLNGMSGTVESISIRTTTIRDFNGNVYTIPNGDIRAVTNLSRGFKRAVVTIPCPYEENQERLVQMIREEMETAAKEIEGIDTVPEVMSIVSFEQNAVNLQIAVVCPVGEHWRVERDIRTRVKARFDREGIVMPHYTLPKA